MRNTIGHVRRLRLCQSPTATDAGVFLAVGAEEDLQKGEVEQHLGSGSQL